MTKKKELYPAYRTARENMKELLTAKANIDQMLGLSSEKTAQKDFRFGTRSESKK